MVLGLEWSSGRRIYTYRYSHILIPFYRNGTISVLYVWFKLFLFTPFLLFVSPLPDL